MKSTTGVQLAGAVLALFFLAACGSMGDILGTGTGTGSTAQQEIRGTVDSIDLSGRSLVLKNVSSTATNLSNSSTVRLYWDDQTSVDYNGTRYSPADLERGDQISARIDESGGRLYAQSMSVLYDSSGTGSTYPGGSYGNTVRATVQYVDTSRRNIQLDQGSSAGSASRYITVLYDTNTRVQFNGQAYRPEDLERGDEVEVTVRNTGSSTMLAETINVIRDVNSGTTGTSTSSLRGTIRYVDTARRTIELEQTTWGTRFDTGTSSVVVLQYDANTTVEYQGRLYAPTNLERGDVIDVQVRDLGTGLYAQKIVVVRSVNG